MQTPQLEPGAILASPQGRGTIVSVDACVTALVEHSAVKAARREAGL